MFVPVLPTGWCRFWRLWDLPGEGRALGSSLEVLRLGHTSWSLCVLTDSEWACGSAATPPPP